MASDAFEIGTEEALDVGQHSVLKSTTSKNVDNSGICSNNRASLLTPKQLSSDEASTSIKLVDNDNSVDDLEREEPQERCYREPNGKITSV